MHNNSIVFGKLTDSARERRYGISVIYAECANNVLGKFRRYEAHIERTVYRDLHECFRLKAARKGQKVEAPQVLDINMTQNTASSP